MKNNPCRPLGGRMPGGIWACLLLVLLVGAPVMAQVPGAAADAVLTEPPDPAREMPPLLDAANANMATDSNSSTTTPAAPVTGPAAATDVSPTRTPQAQDTADVGPHEKLPLDPHRRSGVEGSEQQDKRKTGGGFWQILPALLLVLALLVGCVWAARKYLPGAGRLGGSPAVRLLGRTHLAPRQSIMLVKIGRRVLVVGATGERLTALDSITDPAEVSELIGLSEAGRSNSASASFQNALKDADDEFGRLDDLEGPAAVVSLSQQATQGNDATMEMPDEDGEGNADVGRVRSELDQLRRKVRDAITRNQ